MRKLSKAIAFIIMIGILVTLLVVPYRTVSADQLMPGELHLVGEKYRCFCGTDGGCECVITKPPVE